MSYLVLACSGLDKPEGSVAREVALTLAEETGAEILCPVSLNRMPARYKKALAESELIVVDGCATRCALKLAAQAGASRNVAERVMVSEVAKQSGATIEPSLRPGPDALALARTIVDEITARQGGRRATSSDAAADEATAAAEAPAAGEGAAAPNPTVFPPPSEFVVVVHDKYEFRIPLVGYLFNANDVWVQVAGSRARVGISDYMQQRLTDITFVDLPEPGKSVAQFDELCSVESTKAAFDVLSPVGGTIIAVNEQLDDAPESINEDAYGAWLAELELSDWDEDRALLVDGPAYAAEVERKAAED